MKPIKVFINTHLEAERLNSLNISGHPFRPSDIEECIRYGGVLVDGANNLALTSPFIENKMFKSIYDNNIICSGEINEEESHDGIIVIELHPSRTNAQKFNLSSLKNVEVQVLEADVGKDRYGSYTRIRRARLIPDIDEIQITEERTLDRDFQPSVMLI